VHEPESVGRSGVLTTTKKKDTQSLIIELASALPLMKKLILI
jgi:hypothetical protein